MSGHWLQTSCKAADERLYGVGAGCAQEDGRPVSSSAQRRAQQDFRQAVAVGTHMQLRQMRN